MRRDDVTDPARRRWGGRPGGLGGAGGAGGPGLARVVLLAVLVSGLVSGLAGGVAGVGTAALAAGGDRTTPTTAPPGDTIVAVRGDADEGYAIRHYDGSADFTPTFAEAHGDCRERRTQLERVRCRTLVRTWYADLADLKQALTWAQRS